MRALETELSAATAGSLTVVTDEIQCPFRCFADGERKKAHTQKEPSEMKSSDSLRLTALAKSLVCLVSK